MKRIALALLASTLIAGAAFAKDKKPDFSDKETYSCTDKEDLAARLKNLYEGSTNPFRPQVLYVKSASEYSRDDDLVQCRITMVTSKGPISGYFIFKYEDEHSLSGFKINPERSAGKRKGSQV